MKNRGMGLKARLAEMLTGGVIIEVTSPAQAELAEAAGASGVLVVDRLAAEARLAGGVARMVDPALIKGIQAVTSIPVISRCRIGHLVEAEVLAGLGVDYIDESEALTPVDGDMRLDKSAFSTPFIAGATDLADALRRMAEGAVVVRCSGQPGSGNVGVAARQLRQLATEVRRLEHYPAAELPTVALEMGVRHDLLVAVAKRGKLPVTLIGGGGVATPADAALLRRLGADCILVGSGIFYAANPSRQAAAIVTATAHYDDPAMISRVSADLGAAIFGTVATESTAPAEEQERGWQS